MAEDGTPRPASDLEEHLLHDPVDGIREVQSDSNLLSSTVILSKTIVGAGIAALPLTAVLLGWPSALSLLVFVAWATTYSLDVLERALIREELTSYPEVVRRVLGRWAEVLLQLAVVIFAVGLCLVYCVVIGDMLVGKPGFRGLLCDAFGGGHGTSWACNRSIVVGLVTFLVLLPSVSFRDLGSAALTSWIGMGALAVWSLGTLLLLGAALVQGKIQHVYAAPDLQRLGGSGLPLFGKVAAIVCIYTTSFSCQAAAPFVMAELRPFTVRNMRRVTWAAVAVTTALYAFIMIGSSAIFGDKVQSDVLHNFTRSQLHPLVGNTAAQALTVIVRTSFLLGVLTLFPLMMFPARDGLVRLLSGRAEALQPPAFYLVTYGITFLVYLVSIITPSIYTPLQIIGATAGAVIGFIIPGLLAIKEPQAGRSSWSGVGRAEAVGWLLIAVGVVQSLAGTLSPLLQSLSLTARTLPW